MRKLLFTLTAFLLFAGPLLAQRVVSGKVTDDKGKPLAGVSVMIKGTLIGTVTNADGNYTITVPANGRTLVFSSTEMTEKESSLDAASKITLTSKNSSLDEVVVVAYGTARRASLTSSIPRITADDIKNRPLVNVVNALVGSAPGIQTTTGSGAPGSSPGIRLRGFGSYNLSSSPLIVVDGVPYDGGLANINPEDMESISTLKDASSTSLYGSRAANGVISITTKKGKSGRNNLSFKVVQGVTSRAIPEYEKVNAFEYYPIMWESYRNSLRYNATNAVPLADANRLASGLLPRNAAGLQVFNGNAYGDVYQTLGNYNPFAGVASNAIVGEDGKLNPAATSLLWGDDLNWFDAFYRNGSRGDYGLTYQGGNEKSDYFGSFNYTNEKGFVKRSDLQRFSGRVAINTNPTKWFKTGLNISGAMINTNQIDNEGSINDPFYFARGVGPIYPVYVHNPTTGAFVLDAQGNKVYDIGNVPGFGSRPFNQGRHAIYENELNQFNYKRNNLSARTYGDIIFTDYLKFTANASVDVQEYYEAGYDNAIVGDGAPAGRARRNFTRTVSNTLNQLLNFNKKFGDHNVTALAGHESYSYTYNYLYGFKIEQGFADGNTEFPNFSTISSLNSYTNRERIESYLSRVGYDYKGKYIVTGSLRRDGNSKFAKDVRWDNFWSVGAAWRLDKETFLTNSSWINELKVRGSYGKVGNSEGLGMSPYMGLYALGFNNGPAFGILQSALPNNELTWETAKNWDAGVDFSLFKNRISGTVEYFNRVTDGMIFNVGQPLSNGGSTGGNFVVVQNIGSMYNRGIEATVTGRVFSRKDFNWNVTVNATTFKNQITKMPDTQKEIIDGTKKLSEGRSIYDYWLRDYYGVDPTDGASLYRYNTFSTANCRILTNKDGGLDTVTTLISNAKYIYADRNSIPDVYGSIQNSFRYKNFEMSFMFTYQLGGWLYDNGYAGLMHAGTPGANLHKDALQRWQNPGDVTNVPRMQSSTTADLGAGTSTKWFLSATHLSLNNINIAYNLPKSFLSAINASAARFYISGENVALFAKRKGTMVNQNFSGTNSNAYPPARVISAGINVNF